MVVNYFPNEGDFFISLLSEFDSVRLLQAYREKDDNDRLYAWYYEAASPGKKAEYIKRPIEEFKQPYLPQFLLTRGILENLRTSYDTYVAIRRGTDDFLFSVIGCSALINELVEHLVAKLMIEEDTCRGFIKLLIAEKIIYSYKKLKSGEYLTFSEMKINSENRRKYYGSLADELKLKSDKINLLVSHDQTVGNYREHILREFLKKHIPSKFSVGTGFIEGMARQIDIIIYDSQNFMPSFSEGDLVVIRQEAVRAIIEVKTNLTAAKLKEALELFYHISLPGFRTARLPVFKGVFAFDTEYTTSKSIAEYIRAFYNDPYFEESLQEELTRDVMYLYHEITCVSVLNKQCVFSHYNSANGNDTDNIIPILYSVSDKKGRDIQTAMFISILFDYLDIDYYAKKSTVWDYSKIQDVNTDAKVECKLTADDWLPRTYSKDEHDYDKDSVRKRVQKIHKWFTGDISTTGLLSDSNTENNNSAELK